MTVYVLCFDPPYEVVTVSGRIQRARHYIGFTSAPDPSRRIAEHTSCAPNGSPLVAAVIRRGGTVHLVKKWRCGTRNFERYLKNQGDVMYWCPRCGGKKKKPPTFAKWQRRGLGLRCDPIKDMAA